MALSAVHLNTDVYLVCLTHALSTEKEEIMGLLIGDVSHQVTSYRGKIARFMIDIIRQHTSSPSDVVVYKRIRVQIQ